MEYSTIKDFVLESLENKIDNSTFQEDSYFGFYHVHNMYDFSLIHLDSVGLELFGLKSQNIELTQSVLFQHCLHPEDLKRNKKLLKKYLSNNNDSKYISCFQRMRKIGDIDYELYVTCLRINYDTETINCFSSPVNQLGAIKEVIVDQLELHQYYQDYLEVFKSLSKRELEIIYWVCLGLNAKEIGENLFLSHHTIEKHKKNIYKKTGFDSKKELLDFALNFNICSIFK